MKKNQICSEMLEMARKLDKNDVCIMTWWSKVFTQCPPYATVLWFFMTKYVLGPKLLVHQKIKVLGKAVRSLYQSIAWECNMGPDQPTASTTAMKSPLTPGIYKPANGGSMELVRKRLPIGTRGTGFLLREGCKIKNRLNLGHCPNLPDLPPSPKTWDANLIFCLKGISDKIKGGPYKTSLN